MADRSWKCSLSALILFFSLTGIVLAEGTRTWEQAKFEELSKGTTQGVALRSAGGLELAPAFKPLATTASTYLWTIVSDTSGNAYVAAGSPARIYRITPDGHSSVIFEPKELQVQALAIDKSGTIYAGTNPDGKVYRIEHKPGEKAAPDKDRAILDPSWNSSLYFDPGTKYIWDLALDDAGNLYVATGDKGEIFRVTPKGEHAVFFKSDEAHIRVLTFDPKGNLIAGSDGSGLVYRISPAGEGFVLYSAPKKEITALAIDKSGNIFAAGVGEKRPGQTPAITLPASSPAAALAQSPVAQQTGMSITTGPTSAAPTMMSFPGPSASSSGGSEVYRIALDGSPKRVWASREDLVYALAFGPGGKLLVGTGNQGHIFAILDQDQFTDLLKANANQITAFAAAPNGGLYASTSNLGKIFLLAGASETQGSYESDVFDARNFSRWGRAEVRATGNIDLFARSGNVDNPDRNWSPWTRVDFQKNAPTSIPSARFVQWKVTLHAGNPSPQLESVALNYLPKNVAPDFDDVAVQVGVRYQVIPRPAGPDNSASNPGPAQPRFDMPPVLIHDSDSVGIKWAVHDDNDDRMIYAIYYRGEGETRWLLLKDNVSDKAYSFDASLLPDGAYTVKIVASDKPSHSPGDALNAERESSRFEVDTTSPHIENLGASVDAGQIHATFRASDSFSPIDHAEYSVDAGDWQLVEPAGQISDSKTEDYDFRVKLPAEGAQMDHVVVVHVYDRYDNMAAAKTIIRGK